MYDGILFLFFLKKAGKAVDEMAILRYNKKE